MGSSCTVCRASSRCRAPWKFVVLDPNRFTTNMSDNKLSHLTEGHQGMSQKSFACRMVNKFWKHEHKEGFPHKVSCGSLLGGLHASEALQPYSWIRPVSYCFIASPAIWNMVAAGTSAIYHPESGMSSILPKICLYLHPPWSKWHPITTDSLFLSSTAL